MLPKSSYVSVSVYGTVTVPLEFWVYVTELIAGATLYSYCTVAFVTVGVAKPLEAKVILYWKY